jgi:hypothetical protein
VSDLPDICSVDDVFHDLQYSIIHTFLEIPAQYQTVSMAASWIEKTRLSGVWLHSAFEEVPAEFWSGDFMLVAAQKGCPVLKVAAPEQFPNYREIAIASLTVNGCHLVDVDPRFRDDQMFVHVQQTWPEHMFVIARTCDWLIGAVSDELLDRSARSDPLFALIAPHERLSEPLHRYVTLSDLTNRMWAFHILRENGHLPMLAAKVSEGEWFETKFTTMKKPDSLEDAVVELDRLKSLDGGLEVIFMVYIMTYPIDKVVPAMKGIRLKKLLLEMYSAEALAPFLKTDVELKGAMLESAIGL